MSDEGFVLAGPGFKVSDGSSEAKMYTLKTGSNVDLGTYYLTLKLHPSGDDAEEEVVLTIQVE